MTSLHWILILLTPVVSYLLVKSGFTIKQEKLKVISISLVILSLIILFSPIHFINDWVNFTILLLCLLTFCTYSYLKNSAVKGLFKHIGFLIFIFIFLLLEAIYSQFAGVKDWSSYLTITKITTDKDYRLIHRKVNANFMYPGTHLITIEQKIKLIPILEYQVATVDARGYFDNEIPSQYDYLIDSDNRRLIIKSGSDISIPF